MKATELFHKDGKSAKVWYCEKCRHVASDERTANLCCDWHYDCRICGQKCDRTHYLICDKCDQAEKYKKELKRFNKAEKLTTWDGPVYCDAANHNEGYFHDFGDFLDYLDDDEDELLGHIRYVWACQKIPVVNLSVNRILEDATQEAYEDFSFDQLDGIKELENALNVFNELNKNECIYEIDYSKAILLDKPIKTE